MRRWYLGVVLLVGCVLVDCTLRPHNFAQHPGFAAFYQAHPRRHSLPDLEEQRLLARYRPRFLLPPGHAGLIDFYGDYIASGRLYSADGSLLTARVTSSFLNAHKAEPGSVFVHTPAPARTVPPAVYGRLEQAEVELGTLGRTTLLFLTYHAVFRHSGLPAALTGYRALALRLVGDLDDWHQLDHYTAATIVLDQSHTPVAVVLQQHNYTRTYMVGQEIVLPEDGRIHIDVAIRSNELYPHVPRRTPRRAVRFLSPEAMRYLLGFGPRPMLAADDITDGQHEAVYALHYLPPDDAFYSFQGFLGARRRLPGRDGPPGADYNIWPDLKPWGLQVLVGFFREGDRDDLARFEATYAQTGKPLDFVRAQAPIFGAALPRRPD
ncbi:MAG: hypothetical protein AB7N91_06865 [Candidatus Tectimicrobiota bacterium]